MAKPIRKVSSLFSHRIGLCKIRHISSHENVCKIPKGVIHVQVSFNNTIVTVKDVRSRVISWSSIGTRGFKGLRKGAPFAAQTVVGDAIQSIADQGMQQAKVVIRGPSLGRDAALRAICRSGYYSISYGI